jgi:hypothetical protein
MNTSKLLVIIAIGLWPITALTFVVVWGMDVQWLGALLVLLVPFMTPAVIADHLGWTMTLSWSIVIACCTGVAWLLAAVELWRRPKTGLAVGFFVAWIVFLAFSYYSLQQVAHDL